MKNGTIRHSSHNHKHSHLLQHLAKSIDFTETTPVTAFNFSHITETVSKTDFTPSSSANNCFSANQVLVIIAITCFLNFAFIIFIVMCVQILGSNTNRRNKQKFEEDDTLLCEDMEECYMNYNKNDPAARFRSHHHKNVHFDLFPDSDINFSNNEFNVEDNLKETDQKYDDHFLLRSPTKSTTYQFEASNNIEKDLQSKVDYYNNNNDDDDDDEAYIYRTTTSITNGQGITKFYSWKEGDTWHCGTFYADTKS